MQFNRESFINSLEGENLRDLARKNNIQQYWALYRFKVAHMRVLDLFYQTCGALGRTPNDFIKQ